MSFWQVAGAVTALKILLIPSYYSTDFEVHRNWLAVTYSLPLTKWYYESTSQWTLDYPPLFAWLELLLAQVAQFIEPRMLVVSNLRFTSHAAVLFQRGSVICLDLVFMYAVNQYARTVFKGSERGSRYTSPKFIFLVVLLANFGLLLVDHIHFQYNGFLFGLLLMSITKIGQNRPVEGAVWFAMLLNFKHIFLYIAPAYFVFLFKQRCFSVDKDNKVKWLTFSPLRLLTLSINVATIFLVSFGPFISNGQISQVLRRLFPFKRGLCHAYWAPNFWALYNVADKSAAILGTKVGFAGFQGAINASMTGGLVREYQHAVLPSVSPLATAICTLVSMLPCLCQMWRRPSDLQTLLRGITLCAFSSFLFGWHVHEKAILLILIPLALLAFESKNDARLFLILSTTGHLSLFPLIFTTPELPIKYGLMLLSTVFNFSQIGCQLYKRRPAQWCHLPLLSASESVYLLCLVPLQLYCDFGHSLLSLQVRLPFLPLMLTSVYCSVGVIYVWVVFYASFLRQRTMTKTHLKVN